MALQSLYARAVTSSLPSAIPTTLERIDQFALGKVLTYQKKPLKLLPWRRRELNFTGHSITDLLAEGQQLNFATSSDFLFDSGTGTDKISVQIGLDGELKSALAKLDFKVQTKEEKTLSITTDFGKLTHIQTDLSEVLNAMRIRVNNDHPIIKEARKCGNTLFVVSTIFQAEHCNIKASFSESIDDSGSVGVAEGHAALLSEGASLDDSKSSLKVANRDKPTPIAYLLLRLVIHSNGELIPKLNNRLESNAEAKIDLIDHDVPKTKLTVPRINPSDSIVGGEWVMVDMVREWKPEDSMEAQTEPKKKVSETRAPGAEATIPIPERSFLSSISIPSLDQHYVYSLKEFQCFSSSTYEGIFGESRRWVRPIQANQPLKEAFLEYIMPPESHKKLNKISECLQEQGAALRTSEAPTINTDQTLDPVLYAISTEWGPRLKENTSLIVVAEACLEFPQHVLKKIIELKPEKRELLLNVIKHTPYGVGRHVSPNPGPYNDPDLFPIMRHMGFTLPERHLIFTAPDETEDDILAAGVIVLMLSE